MNCHDARELFSALIDEMLTREERADVYGHLATCAECRRELAAIERTVALVRGAPPVRAPAGFVDRVVTAARPTPWYVRVARAALLPWPVKLPLGAAAVLLVGGLAVLMFRGSQEQQSTARYDTAPRVLADRRATEAPTDAPGAPASRAPAMPPAAPPAPAPPEAASSDRIGAAGEADRAAASRVDPAQKRAEQEFRAESKTRDAAPADNLGAARAPAPAPQSTPSAAGEPALAKREGLRQKAAEKPDVIARLAAPDRDTAERGVVALVARLGGRVTARRVEADATVIEVAIPGDRYGDFAREIGRLGTFSVESEPSAAPDPIRIAVRLRA
jgi:anti-sigma factor RsiW